MSDESESLEWTTPVPLFASTLLQLLPKCKSPLIQKLRDGLITKAPEQALGVKNQALFPRRKDRRSDGIPGEIDLK